MPNRNLVRDVAASLLCVLAACGAPADEPDAGTRDGGVVDARVGDDAGPDGGAERDAAALDGGVDAATDDAAIVDAALTLDASPDVDAATPTDAAAATDAATTTDAGSPDAGVMPSVSFSELLVDPPGTDGGNEFLELRCTPSTALDAYTLLIIEGDFNAASPTARGQISVQKALTGISCGSNGLVVLQLNSVYDGVAGTTYANDFFSTNIQNGTQTLALITGGPIADTDLDDDDDGVIDDGAVTAAFVDSVAFTDGFATDRTYAATVIVLASNADAATRFDGPWDPSLAGWYFGSVMGPSPFVYDLTEVSVNFPAGGTLSPGAMNSARP